MKIITEILLFLHNALTLLFGVYISAAFLGIHMKKKNILTLLFFSLVCGVFYIAFYLFFGEDVTEKLYPLIVHIPLIIFLSAFYKYKPALSALSVLTAYLCCQMSNWVGIAALGITYSEIVYYSVRIVVTAGTFILLMRYVSEATAKLLRKPTKSIIILGLMPFVYYLFDYVAGVYTGLLYSGTEVVVEFLGFVLCIFYILFLFLYFRQYEETLETEQKNRLLKMQWAQSEKEIGALRRSERAVSILRHDMRHFLQNISGFIENGENDKAQNYISEIITAADKTMSKSYCKNEIVNMILCAEDDEATKLGVKFDCTVKIPEKIPVSDVDITSILSNALENAFHAVSSPKCENKYICLDMKMNGDKLLISVRNTFDERPQMNDGMPTSSEAGHGFGTQSIRYIAEKNGGTCLFSISGDMFVLQIII